MFGPPLADPSAAGAAEPEPPGMCPKDADEERDAAAGAAVLADHDEDEDDDDAPQTADGMVFDKVMWEVDEVLLHKLNLCYGKGDTSLLQELNAADVDSGEPDATAPPGPRSSSGGEPKPVGKDEDDKAADGMPEPPLKKT